MAVLRERISFKEPPSDTAGTLSKEWEQKRVKIKPQFSSFLLEIELSPSRFQVIKIISRFGLRCYISTSTTI